MKLFKMAGATLLGTALLVTGCDGSITESLTNEARNPAAEQPSAAEAPRRGGDGSRGNQGCTGSCRPE